MAEQRWGDADQVAGADAIRSLLLWARANRFHVREIEADGVRMVVDDLGESPAPEPRAPRSAHEAFAKQYGIDYSDDDGEDTPDPVEGKA